MKKNKTIDSFVDLSRVDYKELLLLDTKRASQEEIVDANSFPFFKKGSTNESILFIHDIGETPDSLRIMAEYVGRLGYYTYNCRLPGHGSRISYLSKFSFIDWYESLKYGYFTLKNISTSITVIGKGIGAYLGILVSIFNKIDRLILLLPQLNNNDIKVKYLFNTHVNFLKRTFINYNYTEKNGSYIHKYFPRRIVNEGNKLISFLIKNTHNYNKDIPITIHTFDSRNIYYFYKGLHLLNKLKKQNIKIETFNVELLNKFKVMKNA
jgi:carboxylesterase